MKQVLALLFVLCSVSAWAQDVIVKRDGSTIVCRVVEVKGTEIIYKKWGDLEGSNYVMEKSAASVINYENGKRENFSKAESLYAPGNQNDGSQQMNDRALLMIDRVEHVTPQKVKKLKRIGWIGGGIFLASSVTLEILALVCEGTMFHYTEGYDIPATSLLAGGVIWTGSFLLAANHQKKKELNRLQSSPLYQQDLKFSNGTSLSAGIDLLTDHTHASNSLGVGLRFNF